MNVKVKINFVLPAGLHHDIREKMVREGYSLKSKSQWIAEAVEHLLALHNFVDLVKVNDAMKGFEKPESVLVDKSLKIQLDESIIHVRRKYPEIDGVQSRIIRAAILQRIL